MAVFKNKDIDVNVNEKNIDFGNIGANFYTEDVSTSSIRIRIKNNDKIVNLNNLNMTPKLDLFHSDGSIFIDEKVIIIFPEEGLIQYKISDQVIKHPGKVNAKLFLKNETQSVHVANFKFDIQDSGVTDAVEKEITVNLVDDTVRRIVRENAIEILGNDFEQKLNNNVVTHLESKPELFRGANGDSITVRSKYTNSEGNIVLTFSDDTTIEVPKGKDLKFNDLTTSQKQEIKGDNGESITVKSNIINSNGNTLVEFSDDSTVEIQKGNDGKDSTQRNFRDLTIIKDIPLRFEGYEEELILNNTTWYYPQGIAVDDNFYYIAYGTPSNNAKTILVIYDKEFNTVCKYYLGYQYTESMHIEKTNQNRYLYCQYDTGYISKFDISNIQRNSITTDIGTPIEKYNVGVLYRFAKTNDGWVVEQNNQSKGVYIQQDTLVLYDNDLQTRKGVISTFPSSHNELEKISIKRQGLTFIEGSLKYIVGGLYRPNTKETPHTTQGVLEINSDGSIGIDYTYSPNELLNYIENNKTNIDRIEHEGAYTFNNEMYSMIGYRDSAAEDSKNNGLLIVKYGSSDKELTMKEKEVLNIPNAKFNPYKTTINGKLVNEFTGDEITSLKSLITYMANSHISNIVFYTSRANITDLDGKTLPTTLRVEVENHNNLTFFVTYKGSAVNEFYLVTYNKDTGVYTKTSTKKDTTLKDIDLLNLIENTESYVSNCTNNPDNTSKNGFVKLRTNGDVRMLKYTPYNEYSEYMNLYNSGMWQGWKKITTTI